MSRYRPLILTAAALLASGLGACSRSEPDRAPLDNAATDAPAMSEVDNTSDTIVPASEGATVSNAATELPSTADASNTSADATADAPAPAPVDQQMMDDASATGMTSRASRGDQAADDGAPGQTERK
jgi:hypothetical protein